MTPEIPSELLSLAARWDVLKRWERRELGQALRRLGLSYGKIAAIIPVHKATLSGWCREVRLTPEQEARVNALRPALAIRMRVGRRRREQAQERRDSIRARAREEAAALMDDSFWMAGVVAYWAEGGKVSGKIQFANSDPALVRLFVAWCERYLGMGLDRMTAQMHLHDGQDEKERRAFWSGETGIPENRFTKTFVKAEGTGHRKRRLYNGTASIRPSRSGDNLQRILGWIDAQGTLGAASSTG